MRLFDPDDPPAAGPEAAAVHLVDDYLTHLSAVAGLAATTCTNHGLYLRHYLGWWAEARPGRDPLSATPADLIAFQVHEAERGLSAATRGAQVAMLRRFHQWLVLVGRIDTTPAAGLQAPRTAPRDPEFYSPAQARTILTHTRGLEDLRGRQRHSMVTFLSYTGVRPRELRTLPLDAVDLDDGRAKVIGKGSRPRAVLLPAPLVDELRVHLAQVRPHLPDSGLLFINPRGYGHHPPDQFEQAALGREVELAGAARGCRAATSPTSGATYATELVRAGVDIHVVQRLLGHRSIRSTVGYTHLAVDDMQDTVAQVWGDGA